MAMPAFARDKASAVLARMSPRQRQYLMAFAIFAAGVIVLWIVFSVSSGSSPAGVRSGSASAVEVRPTNVDMMAPGAQISDRDRWIGDAGKQLATYESERVEAKRKQEERDQAQKALDTRLAELEVRLKAQAAAASVPATVQPPPQIAAAPAPVVVPHLAGPSTQFPPQEALRAAGGTSPAQSAAPPGMRLGMPVGAPGLPGGFGVPDDAAAAAPALVRVTVSSGAAAGASPAGDAPAGSGRAAGRTIGNFLPVSITRGHVLGGLAAPTGGQAQSNPHPVIIRLSDNSVLPNRFRADYRECFVIASGYGDVSAERAYIRTSTLSCVRDSGAALEVKIEGSIYGEDGKYGMAGRLVSKQGAMLANALTAGIVGGIGRGFATANSTYSTSALGQISTTSGVDALRSGIGSGVGSALDRLAQYYIRLAEQTFPVIEVDAGREIDVVITKGVVIDEPGSINGSGGNAPTSDRTTALARRNPAANDDEY